MPSLIRRRTLSCSWMRHTRNTRAPLSWCSEVVRCVVKLVEERLIAHLFVYCAKIINCLNSIFPHHNVTGVDHATSKEHVAAPSSDLLKSYSPKIILPSSRAGRRHGYLRKQGRAWQIHVFLPKMFSAKIPNCSHTCNAWGRARLLKPLEDAFVDSNSNIVAKIGGCISGELL